MEPSDYVTTLRKRWWWVALCAVLGGTAGYLYSAQQPDQYRSTASAYVSVTRGETASDFVQGSTYSQSLVLSYTRLARLPVVLQPVIDDLGLDTTPKALATSVSADADLDTVIIEISTVSTSPGEAQAIAASVMENLTVAVADLSPRSSDGSRAVRLTTVAPASLPTVPFAPNTKMTTAAGLVLGLGLGVALALLRELTDTKIRTVRDLQRVTAQPVLGTIGFEPRRRRNQLVMQSDSMSPRAEAYRRLRTNLDYLRVEGQLRSVVITSAVSGEGKSTTAINLALAMAEGGTRVLLVDADLRRPSIARFSGLEGAAGLTSVLLGDARAEDVVQPWAMPTLHVMTSGGVPPNPSQLLSSDAMARLVPELVERYDLVIIDIAPLGPVADPAIVARLTDGALVVVGCRRVRRHQVADALTSLEVSGAKCLGVVLNRIARSADSGRDGYYLSNPDGRRWRPRAARRRPVAAPPLPRHAVDPVPGPAASSPRGTPAAARPRPDWPPTGDHPAPDPAADLTAVPSERAPEASSDDVPPTGTPAAEGAPAGDAPRPATAPTTPTTASTATPTAPPAAGDGDHDDVTTRQLHRVEVGARTAEQPHDPAPSSTT